jgi:hypothetical protein
MSDNPAEGRTRAVYVPELLHFCGPNRYGIWLEATFDAEGTVRKCECGKTWVAYRDHHYVGYMGVLWRRETWWARRRRQRKQGKCPTAGT